MFGAESVLGQAKVALSHLPENQVADMHLKLKKAKVRRSIVKRARRR